MKRVFLTGLVVVVLLGFFVAASKEMFNESNSNESDEMEEEDLVSPIRDDLASPNESEMVNGSVELELDNEAEGNETEKSFDESGIVQVSQEGVGEEDEGFYWDREIVNSYFGDGERINIRVKVPGEFWDIGERMKSVGNVNVDGGFSVQASLEDLENELKNKMNNKYSEAEIGNIGLIKKIEFRDLEFRDDISLGIEELDEGRFVQSYAIDPSGMEFVNATVTLVAKGERLYKCRDWNFSLGECFGEWVLFKEELVPGEEYSFILTKKDPGFGEEINITKASHLDSNRSFISDIFEMVRYLDDVWTGFIYSGEYVRATFEQNITNGNVINLFVRNVLGLNSFIEIYEKDGSVVLGTTNMINETGQYDVILSGMEGNNDVFDMRVVGENGSYYLEFDWIHDATRYLEDISLNSSSSSVAEGESINITGSYGMLGTGGSAGDTTIGLNDTNNNIFLDNSCSAGETFQVSSIVQTLCVGCTDNNDGTITLIAPDNGEAFDLIWVLTACPDSSDLSPANLITQETTTTGAILNNLTGNIDISAAPTLEVLYPSNGSTYNTKNLFIKTFVTGNSLDSCWYNLNEAGNVSYDCSTEPGITAVEGYNNLTAYINNTAGYEASDYIEFYVNSSIPLTISITSPENGSIKTKTSPELELLAFDTNFSLINYTVYIYFDNDTLYSAGNNGTLVNNTETTITLSPALTLIGDLTTYKIIINATDGANNATSNVLYYTLTNPAITLVSPDNDYWDSSGNISFSFKVDDAAFSNISCSLLIDEVLNQTNDSSLTGGAITTFNVVGISEGMNRVWKINCSDSANNSGEASRIFTVDKTNPIVSTISDSPDPVNAGEILNITANVTDNFGVNYVTVNISGGVYYMTSVGGGVYYYEYNTTGKEGDYNYSVKGYDNVGNFYENDTGSFDVDTLIINLDDYYGLNSSLDRVDEFNTSNLEEIEYMELNFSLNFFETDFSSWYLNFSANGTDGCSLGNKQSSKCYSYPNWIQFINGTETATYDGIGGNQGDSIQVIQTGSGDNINFSIRIDEHYNPNVFKWYDALYNFSDVKWQDGASQRITKNNMIKIEVNQTLVPVDADQYKLDFRVNYSAIVPDQPLLAYACNSSYATGLPEDFLGCALIVTKLPSELQDDGSKFRGIFTKNLIDQIGDFKYVILDSDLANPNRYYFIKTYNATASDYITHWEYTNSQGSSWSNSGDGYEVELNINWFYNGANPTTFTYRLWANTTNGTKEYLEGNITWNINATNNYPPLACINSPIQNETLNLPYNVIFNVADPNDDSLNVSLYLYQGGVLNKTLVTDMNQSNSSFYWEDSTVSGTYNLTLEACELGTADLFCGNSTHEITIVSEACTYSGSGNWVVECSDNCSISSNIDLLGNNISISGTGVFRTTANITNYGDLFIEGTDSSNRCEVYCLDGGCFK